MISHSVEMFSQTRDKLVVFEDCYEHFYSRSNPDEKNIDNFWDNLSIPKITELPRKSLNYPIIIQELDGAIDRLQLGKAPGMDGLMGEFKRASNPIPSEVI